MTDAPDFPVIILAGGGGRRMGGGKPLQRFGETTLLGHALRLAGNYGAPIAVAVRSPDQVGVPTDVPLLSDDPTIEGPIAGLASALAFGAASGADAVLTLPCDAPLLPADLAARLSASLWRWAGAAVATSGGRLHPTCALWRVSAHPLLSGHIHAGGRSLRGFAEACGMVAVEWAADDVDPFANANTLEDLRRLQPIASLREIGS
jgi:molybdopterin-guanine dinucleotide biosynthesis protein A